MKIRLLTPEMIARHGGEVVTLDDHHARRLVERGHAQSATMPVAKKKKKASRAVSRRRAKAEDAEAGPS